MKRCRLILLAILLTLMFAAALFAEPIFFDSSPVPVGESLDFEVFWMGIPVGEGRLELKEKVKHLGLGRDVYHVVAIAKTNDFLSKIYPIYDEAHSFIDAETLYSVEFSKNLKEGRYRSHEKVVYDYAKGKAYYESLLNGEKKEEEVKPGVHDFLSAFYWFRLQPVGVGKSVKTILHNKGKHYDLEIQVLREEIKEIRGGPAVPSLVVEPKTRLRDVLYQRGRAWVYFTKDKKRIPFWIKINTPFGPVVGVLKNAEKIIGDQPAL